MPGQEGCERLLFSRRPACSWLTKAPTVEALTLSFTVSSDSRSDRNSRDFRDAGSSGLSVAEEHSTDGESTGAMDSEESKSGRSSSGADSFSEGAGRSGCFCGLDFRSLGRLLVGRRSLSLCPRPVTAVGLSARSGSGSGSLLVEGLFFAELAEILVSRALVETEEGLSGGFCSGRTSKRAALSDGGSFPAGA